MNTIEHRVVIHGPSVKPRGAKPGAVGAVLTLLSKSVHGAVDVAFRRSSGAGRRQPWLLQAREVARKDVQSSAAGEMTMYFEAPRLGDVAEE